VSGRVVRRPRCLDDLDAAAAYIQSQSDPERAIRFLRAADSTFAQLAGMPGIGTRYEPHEPLFSGIRYFPVTRHAKYLVFYRPLTDGIEVLRVLQGARDIQSVLVDELASVADVGEAQDTDAPDV
jgi:toxin ParE1/3/4